jgi:heptosyltransferase-2/heptosyltransferase-3
MSAAVQPTVFYFCRLGDMIMLTSLLNRLHRRYRLPSQVIAAGSWNSMLYKGNPDVSRVWSFGRHFPFVLSRQWPAVRRALRDSAPGPIYVCESHYRQLPRIRRMIALSGVDPARCIFISDEPKGGPEHLIDRLTRLGERTPRSMRAMDYPVAAGIPANGPRLYVLEAERAERDAWLAERGWLDRERVIVQPGNHRTMGPRRGRWRRLNTDNKAWPMDRWVTLVHKIQERMPDALVVLRGAKEELPMLREIQDAIGSADVVIAGATLRELFALCESAHSMISVDTGPAHAAAALSLPLVVLYGAESQLYWLPRSPTGSLVIGVGGAPEFTRADQVPVQMVFDAWCRLVNDGSAHNFWTTTRPASRKM